MSKKGFAMVTGFLLVLGAGVAGAMYAYDKWRAGAPSNDNFEKVARSVWEREGARGASSYYNIPHALCLPLPSAAADARSRARRPMAWHLDYVKSGVATPRREAALRQLDALVGVGLLAKVDAAVEVDGIFQAVSRYRLTDKGWISSKYGDHPPCFVYGQMHYLGVADATPAKANLPLDLDPYEVRYITGQGSDGAVASWAEDPALRAAFPELERELENQERRLFVVKSEGKWIDYELWSRQEVARKQMRPAREVTPEEEVALEERKRELAELAALPEPDEEEIVHLVEKLLGVGQERPWPAPCVTLPGTEGLPVDKDMSKTGLADYAVAIFPERIRSRADRVVTKTVPYLNILESLGVVEKTLNKGVPGEGRLKGTTFDALVYRLTPQFVTYLSHDYPRCLPIGRPAVTILDIQIRDEPLLGYPRTRIQYKARIHYQDPPAWSKDPMLLSHWPDLQGILNDGWACEGSREFDRKERRLPGGGSCWWAFDSYVDNT